MGAVVLGKAVVAVRAHILKLCCAGNSMQGPLARYANAHLDPCPQHSFSRPPFSYGTGLSPGDVTATPEGQDTIEQSLQMGRHDGHMFTSKIVSSCTASEPQRRCACCGGSSPSNNVKGHLDHLGLTSHTGSNIPPPTKFEAHSLENGD